LPCSLGRQLKEGTCSKPSRSSFWCCGCLAW
jgi:hypothetical protein